MAVSWQRLERCSKKYPAWLVAGQEGYCITTRNPIIPIPTIWTIGHVPIFLSGFVLRLPRKRQHIPLDDPGQPQDGIFQPLRRFAQSIHVHHHIVAADQIAFQTVSQERLQGICDTSRLSSTVA